MGADWRELGDEGMDELEASYKEQGPIDSNAASDDKDLRFAFLRIVLLGLLTVRSAASCSGSNFLSYATFT